MLPNAADHDGSVCQSSSSLCVYCHFGCSKPRIAKMNSLLYSSMTGLMKTKLMNFITNTPFPSEFERLHKPKALGIRKGKDVSIDEGYGKASLTDNIDVNYIAAMDIKEAITAAMREYMLPELEILKAGQARADLEFASINQRMDDVNKRLDDMNAHLVDQSRRIDAVREELIGRIDKTNERIDENNKRMDAMHTDMIGRIDETHQHINSAVTAINMRMDRLFEVIVRRDEHVALASKLNEMDIDIRNMKQHIAA